MCCENKHTSRNNVVAWLKNNLKGRNRTVGAIEITLSGAPKGHYWNKWAFPRAWLREPQHITHKGHIFCWEPAFSMTLTAPETEFYSIQLQTIGNNGLFGRISCGIVVAERKRQTGNLVCFWAYAAWWQVNAAQQSVTASACLITPRLIPGGSLSPHSGFVLFKCVRLICSLLAVGCAK